MKVFAVIKEEHRASVIRVMGLTQVLSLSAEDELWVECKSKIKNKHPVDHPHIDLSEPVDRVDHMVVQI